MKRHIKYRYKSIAFAIVIAGLLLGCKTKIENENSSYLKEKKKRDLTEIIQDNTLTVLMENSVSSYFIYKGQKLGLEYEILNRFAKEIGVFLEVIVIDNLDQVETEFLRHDADIVACNFAITKQNKTFVNFSTPYLTASQVLIQKKPEGWRKMKTREWQNQIIQNPEELIGKTVHVWQNSNYYERLLNLQEELGDTIYMEALDGGIIPEIALEMVEKGFINYTILDENIASMNSSYYPDVDAHLKLSIKQRIAFGVRKESSLLLKRLNNWLDEFMTTPAFRYIVYKYLESSKYSEYSKSEYSSIKGSKISPFDEMIKKSAKEFGWDWRLIASLMYQESKFQLNLQSWAGAYGLMQLMPEVGPKYGVYPDSPPEVQIRGGIRKFTKDYDYWEEIPDSTQRVKFALASYNAGAGHIKDAQALTEKHGKNPLVWDNHVEYYLEKLSKNEFYKDPVVKNGYFRGHLCIKFVNDILNRYNEYKSAGF